MKENGKVKWFNEAKGYGFITRSTGEDVFVHFSEIKASGYRTLKEGQDVEFELLHGPKGLQAVDVVVLSGIPVASVSVDWQWQAALEINRDGDSANTIGIADIIRKHSACR